MDRELRDVKKGKYLTTKWMRAEHVEDEEWEKQISWVLEGLRSTKVKFTAIHSTHTSRNITKIGAYHKQCVDQSSIIYSYKIVHTMSRKRPSLRRVTWNCHVTHISKFRGRQLRTRSVVMREKNLFTLLASLRGQIFTNKKTLYTKVFAVKTAGENETTISRWDQNENYGSKPRKSGLIRPGLLEPTNVKHILNWCRTTSLKNSNIFLSRP